MAILTMEEVFLDGKRRRVLGYPVIGMKEIADIYSSGYGYHMFLEQNNVPERFGGYRNKPYMFYGMPVLTEVQANTLERGLELLRNLIPSNPMELK